MGVMLVLFEDTVVGVGDVGEFIQSGSLRHEYLGVFS